MEDEDNKFDDVMTEHEQALFDKLLKGKQLKADHPITCLNPDEWFTPVRVSIESGRIFVIGARTCWWALRACEVREAAV